jgi:dTDP-3-amino-3,4,6-trideoxy-alpha-D-glucose transaminase
VGVGSGTDAIALTLRALGIGPGDEVITTSLSAAYTALAVSMVGARPVFADVDANRLTIDPASVEHLITRSTRALLPVHLYGQAADMAAMARIASRHNVAIVEDCCQAHFATADGRPVGTFGAAGALSFYPTKNLGALGDGGAVITNDAALADRIRKLRNGGQVDRYRHDMRGVNSRLDELQAAILRARLPFASGWTQRRRKLAALYRRGLSAGAGSGIRLLPEIDAGHVYHLGVVTADRRDALQQHLARRGIGTLVHYPVPIPRQPAFSDAPFNPCPIADDACGRILSVPLYPSLEDSDVHTVVSAIADFQAA